MAEEYVPPSPTSSELSFKRRNSKLKKSRTYLSRHNLRKLKNDTVQSFKEKHIGVENYSKVNVLEDGDKNEELSCSVLNSKLNDMQSRNGSDYINVDTDAASVEIINNDCLEEDVKTWKFKTDEKIDLFYKNFQTEKSCNKANQDAVVDINIFRDARLLEKANTCIFPEYLHSEKIATEKYTGFIPLSQIHNESDDDSFPNGVNNKKEQNIIIDTQSGVTDSELFNACQVADAVADLQHVDMFSDWLSPINKYKSLNRTKMDLIDNSQKYKRTYGNSIIDEGPFEAIRADACKSPRCKIIKLTDRDITSCAGPSSTIRATSPPISPAQFLVRRLTYESDSTISEDLLDQGELLNETDSSDNEFNTTIINTSQDIELNNSAGIFENLHQLNKYYSQPEVVQHEMSPEKAINEENQISDLLSSFRGFDNNKNAIKIKEPVDQFQSHVQEEFDVKNSQIESKEPKLSEIYNNLKEKSSTIENTIVGKEQKFVSNFGGFSTAAGKNIEISHDKLLNAQKLFEDIDDSPPNNKEDNSNIVIPSSSTFQGFQTARGKEISISDNALKAGNEMYSKVLEEEMKLVAEINQHSSAAIKQFTSSKEGSSTFGGFQSAGGRKIEISDDALKIANEMYVKVLQEEQLGIIVNREVEAKTNSGGFKSASGKNIKISHQALKAAQENYFKLIEEEGDEFRDIENYNKKTSLPKENDNKRVLRNTTNLNISDDLNNDLVCKENLNLQGTSFNGKNIQVSDYSLTNSKSVNDEIISDLGIDASPKNSSIVTFKTPLTKTGKILLKYSNRNSTPLCPKSSNSFKNLTLSQEILECTAALEEDVFNCGEITEEEKLFKDLEDNEFKKLFFDDFEYSSPILSIQAEKLKNRKHKQVRLMERFDETEVCDISLKEKEHIEYELTPEILEEREKARNLQRDLIAKKIDKFKKPFKNDFIIKKQTKGRLSLQQFVNYKSPENYSIEQLLNFGIRISTILITFDNAIDYKFDMFDFYSAEIIISNVAGLEIEDHNLLMNEKCQCGYSEISSAFLLSRGIDPKLISESWLINSYKFVILKLASLELQFPQFFSKQALTPENLFDQLHFRYYREIDLAQRSAIRKILEKDDIPSKTLVLIVVAVIQTGYNCELVLSDGWYSVRGIIDAPLQNAVIAGKLKARTKLITSGAELLHCEEGCSPLEIPSNVRLRLFANSTRRCRWNTKLGYYRPMCLSFSLNSILRDGGLISRITVCLIRVYPLLYVEKSKTENTNTILRSEKVEKRNRLQHDTRRLETVELIYSQVQKEIEDDEAVSRKMIKLSNKKVSDINDPIELCDLLENAYDPFTIESQMTAQQKRMVNDHQSKLQVHKMERINQKVREKLQKVSSNNSVKALLKIRIIDAKQPSKCAILSVWKPSEEMISCLQEKSVFEITNASASLMRDKDLQITAGSSTIYNKLNSDHFNISDQYHRSVTPLSIIDKTFRPLFNEFDTVGIVVLIEPYETKKFQSIYIADADNNLLCINFWAGLKEYAYDDVVRVKRILAISNLQWRTLNLNNRILSAFATELTTFSENPKSVHFQNQLDNLQHTFRDKDWVTFCRDSEMKIKESTNKNSTSLVHKNKNTSILKAEEEHKTSCSFAHRVEKSNTPVLSTPRDFSPGIGFPMPSVQRRIEQLQLHGSPSTLSPLMHNKCKPAARRPFTAPQKVNEENQQ